MDSRIRRLESILNWKTRGPAWYASFRYIKMRPCAHPRAGVVTPGPPCGWYSGRKDPESGSAERWTARLPGLAFAVKFGLFRVHVMGAVAAFRAVGWTRSNLRRAESDACGWHHAEIWPFSHFFVLVPVHIRVSGRRYPFP